MYVYSQGRRIHRRELTLKSRTCSCFQSRQSVCVQTDSNDQLMQIEKLLEESLDLWGETEQKLNQSIMSGVPRDVSRDSFVGISSGFRDEGTFTGCSWISPRLPSCSKGLQVDKIAESFRNVKMKQRKLEMDIADLQHKYRSALSRISELETEIASEQVRKHRVLRYHFDNDHGVLSSTVASRKCSQPRVRQFFFEVRLPLPSVDRPEISRVSDHGRFAYTETFEGDRKETTDYFADRKESTVDFFDASEKLSRVLDWLTTVQPRTYLDAEPLLILAKDVLQKIGVEGRKFLQSEKGKFEKELAVTKDTLERSLSAKEGELQKTIRLFEERIDALEKEHWTQQQAIRRECQDSITYQVTFPMALLRFRNVVLQRRNKILKQRIGDLECRSLLETMLEMSTSDKRLVFQKLFEMESLVSEISPEFFHKSSISEFSMITCSQQILCALEMKHAGRISWINIVSQIFMTTPSNLGRKVLGWYHRELTKKAKLAPEDDLDGLQDLMYKNDALYELRDEIIAGRKDVWDAVSMILQIPKTQAFAEVLGFGPEDDSIVLSLWPHFLIWMEQENRVALAPPDAALQSAIQRLKESSCWADLQLRCMIRRNGCFDLESIPPANRFSLEETYRLVAEIQFQKEQDQKSDMFSMPSFVRQFALHRVSA